MEAIETTPKKPCACALKGIPEGFICGARDCPRTEEVEKKAREMIRTVWGHHSGRA